MEGVPDHLRRVYNARKAQLAACPGSKEQLQKQQSESEGSIYNTFDKLSQISCNSI